MAIELGDNVRDEITGYEGIAVARYSFLYGCERISVERADKDGNPEERVFDEQRLSAIAAPEQPILREPIGGPRDTPQARHREP